MSDPIKIIIVDDHKLYRGALRVWINSKSHLQVIGEASGPVEALKKIVELQPDIVLLDFDIQNQSGIMILQKIRELNPKIKVLMVTGCEDPEDLKKTIAAGAMGFIHKSLSPYQLCSAIDMVYAGTLYIDPTF